MNGRFKDIKRKYVNSQPFIANNSLPSYPEQAIGRVSKEGKTTRIGNYNNNSNIYFNNSTISKGARGLGSLKGVYAFQGEQPDVLKSSKNKKSNLRHSVIVKKK
jgi:hypothetical protein